MKDYSSSGTMADNLDGYVQSSAAADAYLADFTGSITVDTVNKRITVDSTELDIDEHIGFRADLHERKWIKLVGGGYGPDGIAMRIKRVISNRQVEVFPTPGGEPDSDDATDGYLMEKYDATHAFDSSVEWEGVVKADAARSDTPGQLILGEKWVSADNSNLKILGRIFKWNGGSGAKVVTGIRIVGAPGVSKDFYIDEFTVQYLDTVTYGSGATPSNDTHWVSINIGAETLKTSQADNIYGGGQYGYEYIFDTPTPACGGIRITNVKAFDDTRKAEVGMMAIFTDGTSIDMSSGAVLRLSKDGGTNWIPFDIEAVGPTIDYTEVEDAINREVVGFEYEAVRSELGYLWIRRTVAGDNSDLDLDSEDNESTASTACGFTSSSSETRHEDGVTQEVTKLTKDALTIIYRFVMDGDIPGAS
jgi:hypothetical protein